MDPQIATADDNKKEQRYMPNWTTDEIEKRGIAPVIRSDDQEHLGTHNRRTVTFTPPTIESSNSESHKKRRLRARFKE